MHETTDIRPIVRDKYGAIAEGKPTGGSGCGSGVEGGCGAGGGAGARRWSICEPLTGPTQVVPL